MANTTTFITTTTAAANTTRSAKKCKRKLERKSGNFHQQQHNQQTLIPGLPNEIAELCLSLIKPQILYSVCHSWRRFVYSDYCPPFLSLYALMYSDHPHEQSKIQSNSIGFYSYDPISSKWINLPEPPSDPPLKMIRKHPSFISRDFPIQTVTVAGNLVLLAATADNLAPSLSLPLIFNPKSRTWIHGPSLPAPRRWCAAGVCSGNAYVASGIGSTYSSDVAKSVEKLNFDRRIFRKNDWEWEKKKELNDERFSRDAIEAVGFKKKLYMVNVKGGYAKEGIAYDVLKDEWEDMKVGMKSGWRGPVASMDEDSMFCVDEVQGALKMYDSERDAWDVLIEDDRFKGAEQVSAGGGRVCIVCCCGEIAVVDVLASPIRIWGVDMPQGLNALAVHILPRMSQCL